VTISEDDIHSRRCAVCKGAIHHRWGNAPITQRPWLHLYEENWIHDPHNVVPEAGTPVPPNKS